jgi:hypothetical protein
MTLGTALLSFTNPPAWRKEPFAQAFPKPIARYGLCRRACFAGSQQFGRPLPPPLMARVAPVRLRRRLKSSCS